MTSIKTYSTPIAAGSAERYSNPYRGTPQNVQQHFHCRTRQTQANKSGTYRITRSNTLALLPLRTRGGKKTPNIKYSYNSDILNNTLRGGLTFVWKVFLNWYPLHRFWMHTAALRSRKRSSNPYSRNLGENITAESGYSMDSICEQ